MPLVQIKENKSYVRDTYSKALLNTDRAALEEYQARVEYARKHKAEQEETKMRIQKLEQNMEEIKNLLSEIASMRKS